jgi:hypothetical protein
MLVLPLQLEQHAFDDTHDHLCHVPAHDHPTLTRTTASSTSTISCPTVNFE